MPFVLSLARTVLIFLAVSFVTPVLSHAAGYKIGAFYFPGWHSKSDYWNDIKGLPGSRSPGAPWPDRMPLLGYYPEEEQWVTDTHLAWAYNFGINVFAYDWYWDGKQPYNNHAIRNYLSSPLKSKVSFTLLWANHSEVPRSIKEFDNMITYWLENYFNQPTFDRIDMRPLVFIFSYSRLEHSAKRFGETGKSMLERANKMAAERGCKRIFFVATTNEMPSTKLEKKLLKIGYSAYTGWNYVVSDIKDKVTDYSSMVRTYEKFYKAAFSSEHHLRYILPACLGHDNRPWKAEKAIIRTNPNPDKFRSMLMAAKGYLDKESEPRIIMINSWNEFGEGSYIEPTRKWGMKYLEVVREVFGGK